MVLLKPIESVVPSSVRHTVVYSLSQHPSLVQNANFPTGLPPPRSIIQRRKVATAINDKQPIHRVAFLPGAYDIDKPYFHTQIPKTRREA